MSKFRTLAGAAVLALSVSASISQAASRVIQAFDDNWLFERSDAKGADDPAFADSAWRKLSVPHDWSIELAPDQNAPAGGAGAFFPTGVGWYRKHFTVPAADSGRRVFIDFDAIMANSDVYINGASLGHRPYGYVGQHFDLTDHIKFGQDNVIAVRADNSQEPASRWYEGAGIIRHVRLTETDAVHIQHNSVYVTTPVITADDATVHITGTIDNKSAANQSVGLHVTVAQSNLPNPPPGDEATLPPMNVNAGESVNFSVDVHAKHPELWQPYEGTPLYQAGVSLTQGNQPGDTTDVTFGIRDIKFVPETGFWINGKNIKLQGACLHSDASAFGAAIPLDAWRQRLQSLRAFGVNAIRTAHNSPDPAFLDLCDRMGFLVMDETFDCWDVAKNKFDYHLYFDQWSKIDLADTIRCDRNHPSIILWSAGNEIHDTPNGPKAVAILTGLKEVYKKEDPSRPVTQALFRPNSSHDYTDGLAALLDVVGTNYRMSELLAAQKLNPTWTLVGTENHVGDERIVANNPPLSGIFIWAGIDYLGEAGRWPRISGGSGLLDRIMDPKLGAFQVATIWADKPFVQITRGAGGGRGRAGAGAGAGGGANAGAPTETVPGLAPGQDAQPQAPRGSFDWTPANTAAHAENVAVYTNAASVELFLNGTSLGVKDQASNSGSFAFSVPYASGTIKAIARDKAGKDVATQELRTAGAPAKVRLTVDKAQLAPGFDHIAFVKAVVTDADGNVVPGAKGIVKFSASGPGAIVAVDSADGTSHEPFQATQRALYEGSCVAMVRATEKTGTITITASDEGVSDGSVTIQAGER